MSKRFMAKATVVVLFSFVLLCAAPAPARAGVWSPVDPGLALWPTLLDYLARIFTGAEQGPAGTATKTTTTTNSPGSGGSTSCPAGALGCTGSGSGNESGSQADPYGKP